MNKFINRLAGLSAKQAMVFSFVLGGLYYMMFYNDGSKLEDQMKTLQQNLETEEQRAVEAAKARSEVDRVQATVGALSEQFKTVSQALPSEVQMSDIIRTVDTVSKASGVVIKSKEPQPVINREYYEEIPLKITMEGSYSEITLFLYYLASTERIMKVENFTVSIPGAASKTKSGRLSFEGQVVSYRFIGNSTSKKGETK